jgi:hypothetical protein
MRAAKKKRDALNELTAEAGQDYKIILFPGAGESRLSCLLQISSITYCVHIASLSMFPKVWSVNKRGVQEAD